MGRVFVKASRRARAHTRRRRSAIKAASTYKKKLETLDGYRRTWAMMAPVNTLTQSARARGRVSRAEDRVMTILEKKIKKGLGLSSRRKGRGAGDLNFKYGVSSFVMARKLRQALGR